MNIRLLYDVEGWAYHRRCVALQKYAPPGWNVSVAVGNKEPYGVADADVYLQLCYNATGILRDRLDREGRQSKIVAGCNTGWAGEGPREGRFLYDNFSSQADWVVFNSRGAWGLAGQPAGSSWISNGIDRETFACREPTDRRPAKVIWVGSTYHTKPARDIKGWHLILNPLRERLEKRGVECDFRRVNARSCIDGKSEYRTAERMAEWYNGAAVYVCASQSEGTPNPALEAASCGCTIVSTPVGNMPELITHGIDGLLVSRTIEAVEEGVLLALDNRDRWCTAMQRAIAPWHWKERADQYYELFRRLCVRDGPHHAVPV